MINKKHKFQLITLFKKQKMSIKMWAYCFLIFVGIIYFTRGYVEAGFDNDVYSSSGELINVFRMEQELVRYFTPFDCSNFSGYYVSEISKITTANEVIKKIKNGNLL